MKIIIGTVICVVLAVFFTGCQKPTNEGTLKVIATAVPHAEILEQVKPELAREGIQLEIIVVDDYQIPNRALADGEADANFFQHRPFLEAQAGQFGYAIRPFANVHLEPMAIYSQKVTQLSDLSSGAKIGVPSDPANQARALLLLEKNGLIRLARKDMGASVLSISENPKQLVFLELDAPLLAQALADVDAAAINTNFALQAGLHSSEDALAIESGDSQFVNILAIRQGDEERHELKQLKKHLASEKVGRFIAETYQGAIVHVK
jgi:D-methionine transport system substrate-binding protein